MVDLHSPSSMASPKYWASVLERCGRDLVLQFSAFSNSSESQSSSGGPEIAQVKESLRGAEELRDALKLVFDASNVVVEELSRVYNVISIRNGMDRLPDDVLSMIFDYAHDSKTPLFPETLSVVNRQFRRVALHMPKLWTDISSRRSSPAKIATLVARSFPRNLAVTLKGWSPPWHKLSEESAMQEATFLLLSFKITGISSADRLETLCFVVDMDSDRDEMFLLTIQKRYQNLRFPALQTLDITFKNLPDVFDDDDPWLEMKDFYHDWDMPSLHNLKARNFIPLFTNRIPSQLVTCLLDLGYDTPMGHDINDRRWVADEAARFLGSLVNIKELEFSLHNQLFPSLVEVQDAFKLDTLRRLSLTFGLDGVESCTNFFSLFKYPGVESVSLDIVLPDDSIGSPGVSLTWLIKSFESARETKDIAIKMRHEPSKNTDTLFDVELEELAGNGYFNKTKNFRVDYAFSQESTDAFLDFGKNVRSIRIEGCDGEVGNLIKILGDRKNVIKGNAEDGTCLLLNRSILQNWKEDNEVWVS